MNWRSISYVVLALWGTYILFGNEANKVHGEKVTMLFEGLAMIAVVFFVFATGGTGDFAKVTTKSLAFAVTMGILSAGGLYLQLVAMRMAPGQISVIAMITGMWPVLTVAIAGALRIGDPLSAKQWVGVTLAATALYLVNSR